MNNDDVREQMNRISQGIATGNDMADMLTQMIWGAAVTTTRAFGTVTLKIDTNTRRIFVAVQLRWFAQNPRLKRLHDAWLARATRRCQEHVPENWKLLVYYKKGDSKK